MERKEVGRQWRRLGPSPVLGVDCLGMGARCTQQGGLELPELARLKDLWATERALRGLS